MKQLQKVFTDTLQSPDGKWSRKSLTMLVSFIASLVSGFYIVWTEVVNPYAIQVFFGFLLLSGGTSALTVYDKIKGCYEKK